MVEKIGTLTSAGSVQTDNITRHEHHKITIIVSSFVSEITLRIEDISIDANAPINLDGSNDNYIISANGGNSYLIENERFSKLQVTVDSGDATIDIYYTGW